MTERVFISTVSDEFHHRDPERFQSFESYRTCLKQSLWFLLREVEVVDQEELRQGMGDLLGTLDEEIARCTIVIHLIGEMSGAAPQSASLRRLVARHEPFLGHEPELAAQLGDASAISYTQWEAYLAFQHRKGRLFYQAAADAPRSPRFTVDPTQQAQQQQHLERLKYIGEFPELIYDQRDLARKAIASIERFGLRADASAERPAAEVIQHARREAADLAIEIGSSLRQAAKTAITDYDPAGIEAFLRAVDTAALKRELDRRAALEIVAEHRENLRAAVAADPKPKSLYDLAFAELALANYLEAMELAQRTAEIALDAMQTDPDRGMEHREGALNALLMRYEAAQLAGRRDDGIAALEQGLELIDKQAEPILWADYAEVLAEYLLNHARYEEAQPLIDDIVDVREDHQGEEDPALASSLLLWCRLLEARADYRGVVSVAGRAERLFSALGPELLDGVLAALTWKGGALKALRHLADAEDVLRRVLLLTEQRAGIDAPSYATALYATALNNLGTVVASTGRLEEGELLIRRALHIDERHSGAASLDVARDLHNLGELIHAAGRPAEAEPLMQRSLFILQSWFGSSHPKVAGALHNLAHLYGTTNRPAEAEAVARRALAIWELTHGVTAPQVAGTLHILAEALIATGRLAEAEPMLRRALAIDEHVYGPDSSLVAQDLCNMATLLESMCRLSEAERMLRRALAIWEASDGATHLHVVVALNNLGHVLTAMDRLADAELLYRRAILICGQSTLASGQRHPHLLRLSSNYVELMVSMGLSLPECLGKLLEMGVDPAWLQE